MAFTVKITLAPSILRKDGRIRATAEKNFIVRAVLFLRKHQLKRPLQGLTNFLQLQKIQKKSRCSSLQQLQPIY